MMNKLNNKGQSLVMFVCLLPMLLIIILLVVDYGRVNSTKEKLDSINKLAIDYLKENGSSTTAIANVADIITKNDSSIQNINVEKIDTSNKIKITLTKEISSTFTKISSKFKYEITSIYEIDGDKIKRIKQVEIMALKSGKVISIASVKGGVGKTTMCLNLAGIYHLMDKKVLIIDLDLFSGGISVCLDIKNEKDIFMLIDSINNNRFTKLEDYVTKYNKNIDVLSAPKDPRQATKIASNYLSILFDIAKSSYDVILVDTSHTLDEVNLTILDNSYMSLYIITNDLVDLKNMKSLISIFKDTNKDNYLTVLNNSRDTGKDYLTIFEIKNIIKTNIDYTISKNFYIRNIDKYIMNGEILTLNKNINRFHASDIAKLKMIATSLISDNHDKEVSYE